MCAAPFQSAAALNVSPSDGDVDVTAYTYVVTPIIAPFPYFIYVRTDNPDPESFRLVDKESRFYGPDDHGSVRVVQPWGYTSTQVEPGAYYIREYAYSDAEYEDPSIWRVNGGCVFVSHEAYSDGGELVLKQRTYVGDSILDHQYEDTSVVVPCAPMQTYTDYLLTEYTSDSMGYFENLDAVQAALSELAFYPHDVLDTDQPNESRPYPLLATSPYPELSLNEHYETMFAEAVTNGSLLFDSYPFILDSASFPGTMRYIALELDPSAVITYPEYEHWSINVTLNGETHKYGGAGRGGYDPIYTSQFEKDFRFDGSAGDMGAGATLAQYGEKLDHYARLGSEAADEYYDLIAGETFRLTIRETGGTWMRVAREGWLGFGTTFAYAVPLNEWDVIIASEAWVDGRCVNQNEQLVIGADLSVYPASDIILHDVAFTDYYGVERTQDVIYQYSDEADRWEAWMFYTGGWWYDSNMTLPDELVLTHEQVEAIAASWTHGSSVPESGLVCDGTEYPGTPFGNVLVSGIEMPETMTVCLGEETPFPLFVVPEDATYPDLYIEVSDYSVLEVYRGGEGYFVRPKAVGTATVTVISYDGLFTATCEITVTEAHALPGDVDFDGEISTSDALLTLRAALGIR